MKPVTKTLRSIAEAKILKYFDTLDKSGINGEYYRKLFHNMNDKQFGDFIQRPFCFKFHQKPFNTKVTITDCKNSLKVLGVPFIEKIYMPHLYVNKDGEPVTTKPALISYHPVKKMQQFITHKNNIAIEIEKRDMKTGRLIGEDKGGQSSDRELEAMAIQELDNCIKEFTGPKADKMESKSLMYNTISTTGQVSLKDVETPDTDSLSKNLTSVYFLGANIMTNLINQDYLLPYTYMDKSKRVERL